MEGILETDWLFSNLYKYNGKNLELSQQQRRQKFLEEQKQKRHDAADKHRQICESFIEEISINEDEMECDPIQPLEEKKYKLKLMLSEWFTDIPDDLEENWLVKFCPQGFRILLVARNHITKCYNAHSKIILKIRSHFPGGSVSEGNGVTVLDCVFNRSTKTIFVLDCLFWNSMSMLDSEVSFRFFWLKTKFEENPKLIRCLKYNFILLDCVPAQRPLIQDRMFNTLSFGDHNLAFDGTVFYHRESHYTFGYTPLVGWLASYMLPEKLHIDVSPENMVKKPKDYISMEKYLENLSHKKKKLSKKQSELESEMDIQ